MKHHTRITALLLGASLLFSGLSATLPAAAETSNTNQGSAFEVLAPQAAPDLTASETAALSPATLLSYLLEQPLTHEEKVWLESEGAVSLPSTLSLTYDSTIPHAAVSVTFDPQGVPTVTAKPYTGVTKGTVWTPVTVLCGDVLFPLSIGEDGQYSLLARQMICSTDKFGYKPKDGLYALDGERKRWLISLIPDNYAQYATRISNTILFHSVTYSLLYPDTLNEEAYESLGQNVSAGCVRLLAEDAKWIYDNVPAGTPVRFMSGNERDEALLEQLAPPPLKSGKWDPTDPREDNPDYDPSYAARHPEVTPALGVTPAPTAEWTPQVHATPAP